MSKAMKIAIVDDEKDMRQSISQWLALSGFDTETFASAEDALKGLTSDYPGIDEATITHSGGVWDVVGYVDAENGFGANIRVPFTCSVSYTGDDNWRLVDVTLIE